MWHLATDFVCAIYMRTHVRVSVHAFEMNGFNQPGCSLLSKVTLMMTQESYTNSRRPYYLFLTSNWTPIGIGLAHPITRLSLNFPSVLFAFSNKVAYNLTNWKSTQKLHGTCFREKRVDGMSWTVTNLVILLWQILILLLVFDKKLYFSRYFRTQVVLTITRLKIFVWQ